MGKLRQNTRNPNPKRESADPQYDGTIYRRWKDQVRSSHESFDGVSKTSRIVKWGDIPDDVKLFPEIAELNPELTKINSQ